jgi:hypothetical protein
MPVLLGRKLSKTAHFLHLYPIGVDDRAGQGSARAIGRNKCSKGQTMRNLKLAVLALAAILALAAVTASTAFANEFHYGSSDVRVTRSANAMQDMQYETGGKTVECTTLGGEAEAKGKTVTEFTSNPTFSGCQFGGIAFSSAQVQMNGCQFLYTIEAAENRGKLHVRCPAGKQITITVKVLGIEICALHFAEQTPQGFVFYANNGIEQVEAVPSLSGIMGTRQGSSECGSASSNTGSFVGKVQWTAELKGQQSMTSFQVG